MTDSVDGVTEYTYDAWGQVIAVTDEDGFDVSANAAHVANANPFRYRGYYYDAEIGMYYLQSRYYDPVVGRFINGDDVGYINTATPLHQNIYTYCLNSPVTSRNENVKDRVAVHCANSFPRDSKGISSCWLYIKIFFTGLLQSIR